MEIAFGSVNPIVDAAVVLAIATVDTVKMVVINVRAESVIVVRPLRLVL